MVDRNGCEPITADMGGTELSKSDDAPVMLTCD